MALIALACLPASAACRRAPAPGLFLRSAEPASADLSSQTPIPAAHGAVVPDSLRTRGHIPGARHIPLNTLPKRAGELAADTPVAAICAGGYRSSIATSLLEQKGLRQITNVIGGMTAWKSAKLETTAQSNSATPAEPRDGLTIGIS